MTVDAHEAIMEATFDALCERGYANLTMAAIADEFGKSKSLIHYHYDAKDDLMVAFLEWLLESFLDRVEGDESDDPATRLRRMVDIVVRGGDDARDFQTALLEVRAQAPYDEDLRAQLVENDRRIRERIAEGVREGIERGQFRPVDPERYAALFRATVEGAQSHGVILGEAAPTDSAVSGIETLLIDELLLAEPTSSTEPASHS